MPPHSRRRNRRNSADDDEEDYDEDAPQLKGIDRNLPPIILHDLREWNELFDDLQDGENTRESDILGITGVYTRGEQRYRAGIDFDRHKITRDSNIVLIESCDIDSVIAIVMGALPISPRANFGYFMLADPAFTLTENLSIPPVTITRRPEREGYVPFEEVCQPFLSEATIANCLFIHDIYQQVPVHHIPNARLGKMDRFLVLIFFPALYDPESRKQSKSPNVVGDEHMELFYDLAVRLATNAVMPRSDWPASYNAELFRTRRRRNHEDPEQLARRLVRLIRLHTERIIHGHLFNDWLEEIRRLCDRVPELSFARGFFLLVDGKGFKEHNLSAHPPPLAPLVTDEGNILDGADPRTRAIHRLFENYFVPSSFTPGEWYIDIATTVKGHIGDENGPPVSLFVNADLHPEIINHFSGVPLDACSRAVRKLNDGYSRDLVAHLSKFAGFRKTFNPPGDDEVVKLQVYTTDKGVTYRPDAKSKATRTSPRICLEDWKKESTTHFQGLADVYWSAPESHSVAVRIESRVPFESYPHVHLHISRRVLQSWLYWCRNTAFWGFRWRRLNGIWNVMEEVCGADEARSLISSDQLPEVGSLVILLTYMANALIQRPDDGGHFDEVHDTGCVHEIKNYQLVPVVHLGYYIISSLRFPRLQEIGINLPRISSQRSLSLRTILYLLGTKKEDRTELHALQLIRQDHKRQGADDNNGDAWGIAPQEQRTSYPHTSNKRRVTLTLSHPARDVFADLLPDQGLRRVYSSEEEDHEARERLPKLSYQVSQLVYTYPLQIIAKLPNRQDGGGSWSRLTEDERSNANFQLFCDASAPSRIFISWNNFGRDGTRWTTTVTALFPTRKEYEAMGKTQGLSGMDAWKGWYTLLRGLSSDAEKKTVRETRNYVSQHWRWLPFYTRKKLWVTGEAPATRITRKVGPLAGGPWIVFNPRFLD